MAIPEQPVIWIKPDIENHKKLMKAFGQFGFPAEALPLDRFLDTINFDIFTFGRPPVSIEILTKVLVLEFDETWKESVDYVDEGLLVKVIHLNHLLEAKRAAGRPHDLSDIEKLSKKA